MNYSFTIFIMLAMCLCIGCSTLFAPQQWSENYALGVGVESNVPEAVDGEPRTVSNSTRIWISLPEKKSIRKIVIYSPNISDFILYESIGKEGEWKIIKSIKGNRLSEVVINTQVVTDKIRMFVSDTRGSRFAEPESIIDMDGNPNLFSRQVDAAPQIQEIELYGLVDKVKQEGPLF